MFFWSFWLGPNSSSNSFLYSPSSLYFSTTPQIEPPKNGNSLSPSLPPRPPPLPFISPSLHTQTPFHLLPPPSPHPRCFLPSLLLHHLLLLPPLLSFSHHSRFYRFWNNSIFLLPYQIILKSFVYKV